MIRMRFLALLLLLATAALAAYDPCAIPPPNYITGQYPKDFVWAAATAAYQIEGGWNAAGKGQSIWDKFSHTAGKTKNGDTGDVACDSYHKDTLDIGLMKAMNLKYYRFSISWPRLLPTGLLKDGINHDGVRYYGDLIKNLTAQGITPMVTLYHWDLPLNLQNMNGWLNPASPTWYRDYAYLCFSLFGASVPYWITFNEAWTFTVLGYGTGVHAPGISNCLGTCPYQAAHHVLLAHANAYHLYKTSFQPWQGGKVGMTNNIGYNIPVTQTKADTDAVARAYAFNLGWFAQPVYGPNGDYPQVMKDTVARRSKAEGRTTSRMPSFTPAQVAWIKGTADFFGLNFYTSGTVQNTPNDPAKTSPSYFADQETSGIACPKWQGSGSNWLYFTPWGMRGILNHVKNTYGNIPIIVTENGWSDNNGSTSDWWRVEFYRQYGNMMLKARLQDGVNIMGYTAWSLMDNFEWAEGYTEKFGIHAVDMSTPARTRTAKDSSRFFASLAGFNGFSACHIGSPCANGGTCVSNAATNSYSCNCAPGFGGNNCNIPICSVTILDRSPLYPVSVSYTSALTSAQASTMVMVGGNQVVTAVANSVLSYSARGANSGSCTLSPMVCRSGRTTVTCIGSSAASFGCLCH